MTGQHLHNFDLALCAHAVENVAQHMARPWFAAQVDKALARQPLLLEHLKKAADPSVDAEDVRLLLSDKELKTLATAVEFAPHLPWQPYPELHWRAIETYNEVRDQITRQASEDWSGDCSRSARQLEDERLRLAEGIDIIRRLVRRLRTLLRVMGAVELLPAPEGLSQMPTHPSLVTPTPSAPSTQSTDPMAVPLSPVEAAPSEAGESGVKGSSTQKPAEPTRESCLLPPNLVQWDGSVEVQQRLWHLLGVLLDKGGQASAEEIEEAVSPHKDRVVKALYNDVSALNKQLEQINWPFTYRCKSSFVVADRKPQPLKPST